MYEGIEYRRGVETGRRFPIQAKNANEAAHAIRPIMSSLKDGLALLNGNVIKSGELVVIIFPK